METIQICGAGKRIKDAWIFKDISVICEAGKIYGLIGRNGAGKTMLLRCICGLSSLSEGEIIVQGKRVGIDVEIPDSVGVIIEVPGFLPNLSGYGNLKYLADLTGRVKKERIEETIELVGLNPKDKKKVGKYSLGMRQRLGIAQALMEDPDILLLDEPMNGLDNNGVSDVKRILKDLKSRGKTIILASHHMEDIDELCDKVYRMDQGHLCE
ncbi:MAG: ATP-binding cassette domain-containing protein [Saccharofermentans sp.]|nr:ATP-binding cassette domain-containing protein [Saccharofermentans sp.]